MSETKKTDARVVQHRATSYDATDDPDTNMPSAKVPKFSLVPENEKSKLKMLLRYTVFMQGLATYHIRFLLE